jgi:2-keto-4-pentenoate hydratase/2-oxohepta-3-ene-1,7-dioic acid hydratase in catechol pathway
MRVASVRHEGRLHAAFVFEERAYLVDDVGFASQGVRLHVAPGARELFESGDVHRQLHALADHLPRLAQSDQLRPHELTALGPPIPHPGKIICVGRNYGEHARELGNEPPARPILFAKLSNAIIGPYDDIVRPLDVDDLDYEAELCVVIGRGGRHILKDKALDHVAGYCCANDVSARQEQLAIGDQWLRGKSHDTFCPIGPAIVTRDEIPDPQHLRIQCRVDGEVMQDATTAGMTFDVVTLISYISDAFTLEPGDLILTGTPAGVAMGRTPPPWLQPGQICEVEIEGIGVLRNRIAAESDVAANGTKA